MKSRILAISWFVVGCLSMLLVLNIGLFFRADNKEALAQNYAQNYYWADSLASSTAAIDSAFDTQWKQVTIYSDTADVWFRAGAPDTASWSSRKWMKLDGGDAITFGPATPLRRFEWKLGAGTDVLYFVGYKTVAQY